MIINNALVRFFIVPIRKSIICVVYCRVLFKLLPYRLPIAIDLLLRDRSAVIMSYTCCETFFLLFSHNYGICFAAESIFPFQLDFSLGFFYC